MNREVSYYFHWTDGERREILKDGMLGGSYDEGEIRKKKNPENRKLGKGEIETMKCLRRQDMERFK